MFVCLSVCLFVYLHDISKTDAARITKLDRLMIHDESCKPIYYGVSRSKVKVASHKNIAGVGLCILVSAGVFSFTVLNSGMLFFSSPSSVLGRVCVYVSVP